MLETSHIGTDQKVGTLGAVKATTRTKSLLFQWLQWR